MARAAVAALAAAVALALLAPAAATAPVCPPVYNGCMIRPPNDEWNRDISTDPVDYRSSCITSYSVNGMQTHSIHLDLGSATSGYGIPYILVDNATPLLTPDTANLKVGAYRSESDRKVGYPVPPTAPIESQKPSNPNPTSGDRHVSALNTDTCELFEFGNAKRLFNDPADPTTPTGFSVSGCYHWDLNKANEQRPAGWTSADAAGLPIFPGLLKYDELAAGPVMHALRFTLPSACNGWQWPASHFGPTNDGNLPLYGMRFRLKASFDETPYPVGIARNFIISLKRFGLMYADQGSSMYVQGEPDNRWTQADATLGGKSFIEFIHTTKPIAGSQFEIVQNPSAHPPHYRSLTVVTCNGKTSNTVPFTPTWVSPCVRLPCRPTIGVKSLAAGTVTLNLIAGTFQCEPPTKFKIQRRVSTVAGGSSYGAWVTRSWSFAYVDTKTPYTDASITQSGFNYQYRIVAYNSAGWSQVSPNKKILAP